MPLKGISKKRILFEHPVHKVYQTRAMRGAECWTDHRLTVTRMNLRLHHGASRRRQNVFKKINCAALKDDSNRQGYVEEVRTILQENQNNQQSMSAEENWKQVSQRLLMAANKILGSERKNHRDWFRKSATEIQTLWEDRNRAHTACLRNPLSVQMRRRFTELRARLQSWKINGGRICRL